MLRILSEMGLELPSLMAGLLGGVLSLRFQKGKATPAKAAFLILAGAITAGYLTPMIATYGNISVELQNALSFIIGLASMRILEATLVAVDKLSKKWINEKL